MKFNVRAKKEIRNAIIVSIITLLFQAAIAYLIFTDDLMLMKYLILVILPIGEAFLVYRFIKWYLPYVIIKKEGLEYHTIRKHYFMKWEEVSQISIMHTNRIRINLPWIWQRNDEAFSGTWIYIQNGDALKAIKSVRAFQANRALFIIRPREEVLGEIKLHWYGPIQELGEDHSGKPVNL